MSFFPKSGLGRKPVFGCAELTSLVICSETLCDFALWERLFKDFLERYVLFEEMKTDFASGVSPTQRKYEKYCDKPVVVGRLTTLHKMPSIHYPYG